MKTTFRKDLKVAFLLTNGFHDNALLYLKNTLEEVGVQMEVVSPEKQSIKSGELFNSELNRTRPHGLLIEDFQPAESILLEEYQMIIIPDGSFSSFKLLSNSWLIEILSNYFRKGGIIAAMGHGTRVITEMNEVKGKMVTSPTDFKNDFAQNNNDWFHLHVVDHDNLITCQREEYIYEFAEKIKHALEIKEAHKSFVKKVEKLDEEK